MIVFKILLILKLIRNFYLFLQRAKAMEMEKLIKDMNAGIACFQQQMLPQ